MATKSLSLRKSLGKKSPKPTKPYSDFPLFAHATRRWAKKIRGKFHYFGPWDDWQGALEKYNAERDYLHAGKLPPLNPDAVTVCNAFLTHKDRQLKAGEIKERTFIEYRETCVRIRDAFGRNRVVGDLTASDFGKFREQLATTRGPVTLGNEVTRVRSVFKFGYDDGLIEMPVRYGQQFKKPTKSVVRMARNNNDAKQFDAEEIKRLIDAADVHVAAMIWLGINCAFEPHDCGDLNMTHLDLDAGIIDFPRPKTGVARLCPLWPETAEAIQASLVKRPHAFDKADSDAVFLTVFGARWVRGRGKTALSQRLAKLRKHLEIEGSGKTFLALRHTFRTHAGETGDIEAVDRIMGHEPGRGSSAIHYIEDMPDERLRRVVDHVRSWLLR